MPAPGTGRVTCAVTSGRLDGSSVTGKLVAKAPAPDASAIPWLLVTVVSRDGKGKFERVTSIQRVHTKGGQAPPAQKCDPSKPNAETCSFATGPPPMAVAQEPAPASAPAPMRRADKAAEGAFEAKRRGDKEATMIPRQAIVEELVRRVGS